MSNKMHSAGKIFIIHSEVKSGLAVETHFARSYFLLDKHVRSHWDVKWFVNTSATDGAENNANERRL